MDKKLENSQPKSANIADEVFLNKSENIIGEVRSSTEELIDTYESFDDLLHANKNKDLTPEEAISELLKFHTKSDRQNILDAFPGLDDPNVAKVEFVEDLHYIAKLRTMDKQGKWLWNSPLNIKGGPEIRNR